MAEKKLYFDFAILSDLDNIPLNTFISGRIYNIAYNFSGLYGPNDNPIVKSKLVEEGTNYYLYCYSESDEVVFVIGGYLPNGVYNNPYPMQYLIGIEEDSDLYNILIGYADYVHYKSIEPQKFTVPTTEKYFMSYNFNSVVLGFEKKISCLLDFKIGDTLYVGFDFVFEPNSNTPTYMFLYQPNGDNVGYITSDFIALMGTKIFEILNGTDIPEPIYDWLTYFLEPYIDPNMVLSCYTYSSQFNRVDKTDYLTKVIDIVGVPREEFILTHPSFTIELDSPPNFNYVYIQKLNRYFFVEDVIYLRYKLYEIRLKVDVLMTYKNGLLQLDAFVDRNEFTYNENIIDKKRVFQQGVDVSTLEILNNVNWMLLYNDGSVYDKNFFVMNGYKLNIIKRTEGE